MPYEGPPPRWKKFLHQASRSQRFLWKSALGIVAIGAVVGYALSHIEPSGPGKFGARVLAATGNPIRGLDFKRDEPERPLPDELRRAPSLGPVLERELADATVQFGDVLRWAPLLAPHVKPAEFEAVRGVLRRRFSAMEADIVTDMMAAWNGRDPLAYDRLAALAEGPTPPPHASFALGMVDLSRRDFKRAYVRFHQEGERKEAHVARWRALHALILAEDFPALARLQANPAYTYLFTPYISLQVAVGNRDWPGILKWVPLTQFTAYETRTLALTLIAGAAWAFFLATLGEWPRFFSKTGWICLFAFALGALSTLPTLYLVILQDDMLKWAPDGDVVRTIAYYVAGVGAREEVCKLLLFTPLVPWLLKRDDELEVLVVASFVGLGFAVEENASYLMRSEGTVAAGRFLSANFFHLALTGVNGLALFRLCRWGTRGLNEFLYVLPLTILAHGLYDAFMSLPTIDEGGYLSMVVYVLFCFFYFRRAQELQSGARMTVSLTGAFVFGMSVLGAALIVHHMTNLGAVTGSTEFFSEALGNGMLLLLFFRVFNEPLAP